MATFLGGDVYAWIDSQADCPDCPENFSVPAMAPANAVTKVKPSNRIMKCKPLFKGAAGSPNSLWGFRSDCILPMAQHKAGKRTLTSFSPGSRVKLGSLPARLAMPASGLMTLTSTRI